LFVTSNKPKPRLFFDEARSSGDPAADCAVAVARLPVLPEDCPPVLTEEFGCVDGAAAAADLEVGFSLLKDHHLRGRRLEKSSLSLGEDGGCGLEEAWAAAAVVFAMHSFLNARTCTRIL